MNLEGLVLFELRPPLAHETGPIQPSSHSPLSLDRDKCEDAVGDACCCRTRRSPVKTHRMSARAGNAVVGCVTPRRVSAVMAGGFSYRLQKRVEIFRRVLKLSRLRRHGFRKTVRAGLIVHPLLL